MVHSSVQFIEGLELRGQYNLDGPNALKWLYKHGVFSAKLQIVPLYGIKPEMTITVFYLFYPIECMWPKIILLCKRNIFNLKYRNS